VFCRCPMSHFVFSFSFHVAPTSPCLVFNIISSCSSYKQYCPVFRPGRNQCHCSGFHHLHPRGLYYYFGPALSDDLFPLPFVNFCIAFQANDPSERRTYYLFAIQNPPYSLRSLVIQGHNHHRISNEKMRSMRAALYIQQVRLNIKQNTLMV
jgi:hypothetical protein